MARISDKDKAARKERIRLIVRQHNGIRERDIVKQIGFGQRTVNNYLRELEYEGKLFKKGVYWHEQEFAETELRRFTLSAEQTLTLYLLVRLFVKQTDKRNEIAEHLLIRLTQVLRNEEIITADIAEAAKELAQRKEQRGYLEIYRTILRSYVFRRRVQLTYQPAKGDSFETDLDIYLIEPSSFGHATYLIGYSTRQDKVWTYKLERVVSAEILPHTYIIPVDFPGLNYLKNAWSIYSGDKTERVVLRFSKAVKSRVLESNWHRSQGYDDQQPDGSLLWWVDVASTIDIFSWVRQWGSSVEILEPDHLREEMKAQVVAMTRRYALERRSDTAIERLLLPWGKTTRDPNVYHPALYHMIDVAHVAYWLLSSHASPRWRNVLAHTLGANAVQLQEWLPFFIALHDVGKISVTHQVKNQAQVARLTEARFGFGKYRAAQHKILHHTIIGWLHLMEVEWVSQLPRKLKSTLLTMVAGHHGYYPQRVYEERGRFETVAEPPEWAALRVQATNVLRHLFMQLQPQQWPDPSNVSAAIATLNGFTTLCDWLGSDQTHFQARPHMPLLEYVAHSRKQAFERLKSADFFQPVLSNSPTQFDQLFQFAPRPLQAAADAIPQTLLAQPTLTIVEAPTGEGKTEAALALAHRIGRLRGSDELYLALPTTATSNAMYARLQHHLHHVLHLPNRVKLIHGQDYMERELRIDFETLHEDAYGGDLPALDWFAPKKQALLAPFGVGTVDQAELTALNVRHSALRLMGLAGKTVILDEIHAYDTYMLTIIGRMLAWLSEIGTSVILLSATLPTDKRQRLAQAYAGANPLPTLGDSYPALITVGADAHHIALPAASQPRRTITLGRLHFGDDVHQKAAWLLTQVADGGCVCWITNTVAQAQAIFRALLAASPDEVACTLIHARLPLEDRQAREMAILSRYGKPSAATSRPHKGIVVGTQVLEQSLDLDFDLMVSDLAPIDLLFQRAGRLHRHTDRRNRSPQHPTPTFYVHALLDAAGDLQMGADKFYGEYILRLSWQQLLARFATEQPLTFPDDYRPMVEAVYNRTPPVAGSSLHAAWEALIAMQAKLEEEAKLRLTPLPHARRPFSRSLAASFKEDEDSNAWRVAQTRYSERQSLTVIPLERISETHCVLPDGVEIALNRSANRETQLRLLKRQIRVSTAAIVTYLLNEEAPPPLFTESTLLKNCYPLWLRNNRNEAANILLDAQLGLAHPIDSF